MLEKCQKRPLSKNENTKAIRYFEANNYQEDDLHANRNKTDSLFNDYDCLKSPPPVHSLNFTSFLIPMFLILGLKFKLKSKL